MSCTVETAASILTVQSTIENTTRIFITYQKILFVLYISSTLLIKIVFFCYLTLIIDLCFMLFNFFVETSNWNFSISIGTLVNYFNVNQFTYIYSVLMMMFVAIIINLFILYRVINIDKETISFSCSNYDVKEIDTIHHQNFCKKKSTMFSMYFV